MRWKFFAVLKCRLHPGSTQTKNSGTASDTRMAMVAARPSQATKASPKSSMADIGKVLAIGMISKGGTAAASAINIAAMPRAQGERVQVVCALH